MSSFQNPSPSSQESRKSHESDNSDPSSLSGRPEPPYGKPPMAKRSTSTDSQGNTVKTSLKSPGASSLRKFASKDGAERKQQSVDFDLDYFTSKDPAESSLIDVLEGGTATRTHRANSIDNVNRSRNSRLPYLIKQMSSRRHMAQNSTGSSDSEPINNRDNGAANYHSTQPSSDSNLMTTYESMANNEGSSSIRSARRRTSSANSRADLHSGMVRQRRKSVKAQNLTPTSHFLANLAENLDESSSQHQRRRKDSRDEDYFSNHPKPSKHKRTKSSADALLEHAQHLESMFSTGPQDMYDDFPAAFFGATDSGQQPDDMDDNYSDISDDGTDDRDMDLEGGPDVRRPLLGSRVQHNRDRGPLKRAYAHLAACFKRLGLKDIRENIWNFMTVTVLMTIVPLLSLSALLFYCFNNPDVPFMPTDASLSWWLIFSCRMIMTYKLALIVRYVLDILTHKTNLMARFAGPLVALMLLQSQGWAIVLAAWGGFNLCLLHGPHPFVKNWLWFLDIRMLSKEYNSDHGILESDLSGRLMTSMVIIGMASAAKKTVVALYLNRRMLGYFRAQLQELLSHMKVVVEIAEMAAETEGEDFRRILQEEEHSFRTLSTGGARSTEEAIAFARSASKKIAEQVPTLAPRSPQRNVSVDSQDDDDNLFLGVEEDTTDDDMDFDGTPTMSFKSEKSGDPGTFGESKKFMDATESVRSQGPMQWNELKIQSKPKRANSEMERSIGSSTIDIARRPRHTKKTLVQQLEPWEEPETKGGKVSLVLRHNCWDALRRRVGLI